MKRSLLALALATMATSSFAYDAQMDGGFTYFDIDQEDVKNAGQFDVKGTFYFEPVQTKNGPFNEAAFLGNNSNVYGEYNYHYTNGKTYHLADGEYSFDDEIFNLSAGVEYFYNQFYANAQLGYAQNKYEITEADEKSKDDYDITTYRALVGFLPMSNLLLAVGVDGYQGDENDDEANFAVKAKYVTSISQNGQYLNFEADATFGDLDQVTLGTDYYFNQAFSLGAAYTLQDDNEDDIDFFSVRSKYFINQNLAIGAEVGFGDDVQGIHVNTTVRF